MSVATAGNDHRLGANEAPPAIVSMFLGDQLTSVLDLLITGKSSADEVVSVLETGVDSLPIINKDATDRNRTSPFAFTGNKFEFRMPGSAQSIAGINIVINTIVADALKDFADELEKQTTLRRISWTWLKTIKQHSRIIFNGNNYSDEWVAEAEKRGLPNLKTTVDALPVFVSDKVIKLFEEHGVFNEKESRSRCDILIEDYSKAIHIELLTMLEMAKQQILPSCIEYSSVMIDSINKKKSIGLSAPNEEKAAAKLTELTEKFIEKIDALEAIKEAVPSGGVLAEATYYKDTVLTGMNHLRAIADELETVVAEKYWPFPCYEELLYNI